MANDVHSKTWRVPVVGADLQPKTVIVGLSLALPTVGLSPPVLGDRLGEWNDFLSNLRIPLWIAVAAAGSWVLLSRLKRRDARGPGPLAEEAKPATVEEAPHIGRKETLDQIRATLEGLGESDSRQPWVVRLWLMTGVYTLTEFKDVLRKYRTLGHWDLKILLLDPESPWVELLDSSARKQILASADLLADLQREAKAGDWTVRMRLRYYDHPPMFRGFLIGNEDLFIGYTECPEAYPCYRLQGQGQRLHHVTGDGDQRDRDQRNAFETWFDYVWRRRAPGPDES